MLSNADKPSLRFSAFFDSDWKESKLGNIAVIERGRFSPRPRNDPQFYGGNTPFAQTNDVVSSKGYVNSYSQTLNDKGLKVSKLFPEGTILMTIAANIGYCGVLNEPMACPDSLVGITCKEGNYNSFLNFYLNREQPRIDYLAPKGAQKNINIEFLKPYKVKLPTNKKEQQKIADFLTSVDTKISQLTEKHRLLKDYKKGVMQQIFSQQIRFKDDDGSAFPDWEEKVIGNVMTESRIKGSSGDTAKKLTVKIWGKGVIPKKDDSKGSENTQYYKRKAGQFIYGKLDFLNCAFAIIPDELDGYESTLDLPSLDVSSLVNKFFVLEVVKQKQFYKRFGEIADGSRKAKRINVGVFQEMPITLPSKAEQNKIMAFLDSLDKKTNAVNEQIEQTKLFKKGLLQQMFV
ncbi:MULTISPECIES: restriction endonuclease subunit S [unclassified Pseudoalteromonas]|uniref:restriction endonuclease subunit S n=1 Tax=unclassified Pseudoalteromonas TaxID=194690 RepID=UPI00110BC102|nr:restriction endonuclease subunit S [Pseudoalteromonas sp. S1688]TMP48347.1 restriction endonuclease subunit S [Pseudoalteromonas sp. S1688]